MQSLNGILLLCIVLIVTVKALPTHDGSDPTPASASTSKDGETQSISRIPATMSLPSNATAIRADITDTFSCAGKIYGYYADVDNDCQIFHICLPVIYADGKENMFRWSFVCPDETIFSQELFTCIRPADWSSDCTDSSKFVELNRQFGATVDADEENEPAATLKISKPIAQQVVPVSKPTMVKTNVFDAQPVESQLSVNVVSQPASFTSLDSSASLENLPVFDAASSETQTFGFFKVDDSNESTAIASTDSKAAASTDAEALRLFALEQHPPSNTALDSAVSLITEALQPTTIRTDEPMMMVTENSNASHVGPIESTELWNQLMESPYDGGSTIDDIVEVNAILETDESGTTETISGVAKPSMMVTM